MKSVHDMESRLAGSRGADAPASAARSITPFGLALALAVAGCTAGGGAPTVEITGVSPESLSASDDAADDLTITVRYLDPDGDLGEGSARILDCRAEGLVTVLPLPRIANEEAVSAGVPIEGEMALVLSDIGAAAAASPVPAACAELGAGEPSDGAQVFCVALTDASGNESEGACTAPVKVDP